MSKVQLFWPVHAARLSAVDCASGLDMEMGANASRKLVAELGASGTNTQDAATTANVMNRIVRIRDIRALLWGAEIVIA